MRAVAHTPHQELPESSNAGYKYAGRVSGIPEAVERGDRGASPLWATRAAGTRMEAGRSCLARQAGLHSAHVQSDRYLACVATSS